MIIGIDGNEANVEKRVGVSVYTINILSYFQSVADSETQFTVYLRNRPLAFLPPQTQFFRYIVIPGPFAWLKTSLPLYLSLKRNIDVFFSPAHYTPPRCPSPIVVTIHDLSYMYYPNEFLKKDLYKLKHWTEESVKKASKIICVSQTTKKDVVKFYSTPENKIEVIYNGFEKQVSGRTVNQKEVLSKYTIEKNNYLLYVGTLQPRKNILFLIKAFWKLHIKFPQMKLVIVGKRGWLYDQIFKLAQELKLGTHVIFTDYVPDSELVQLYRSAFSFVHPSLYEGFGIPVVEAMSHSCPVLSSFASSLPEVGGDACLYFDPKNEEDLMEKITLLYEKPSLRKELIEKGKIRVTQFSWEKCAKETLLILKSVGSL